jgi:3-oxoacyl-[acyl-carrier-protein] synthase-3
MKVKLKGIEIASIVSCIPKNKVNLNTFASEYGNNEVSKIIKMTGIETIRQAEFDITTSDLCLESAKELIRHNNINPCDIDAVIFVSQTADYIIPQTSHVIQDKLKLSEATVCFDLPVGCNGYIYGLYQASLLISSNSCKNVLLLSGDTSTKLINEKDKSLKMVFGDGASATLIREGVGELSFIIYSDGSQFDRLIIPDGGCRTPINERSSQINFDGDGNGRTSSNLYMDGMAIFNFAIKRVPPLIDEILDFVNWKKDEVDLYALHQANKFMIDYLRKKCRVPLDKMPVVVDGIGNTGPGTIPILLTELNTNSQALHKVVLCGFGIGLSWGAVSCNLSKTKILNTIEF